MEPLNPLDVYLSPAIRAQIAERYLNRISDQARMEQVIYDPNFYSDPLAYPPFYADHGVVHHLDVAHRILEVLDAVQGLLIPTRQAPRLEFMKGYGVILACVHDIGMYDLSPMGRAVHPQVASQAIFCPDFDDLFAQIWSQNSANLAWRLTQLAASGKLAADPALVLREMLAMSNCHSKSNVPIAVLNEAVALRRLLQAHLSTPLHALYYQGQIAKAQREISAAQEVQDRAALERGLKRLKELERGQAEAEQAEDATGGCRQTIREHYADFESEAYAWLVSSDPAVQELVMDVIDTLRALRCADALRQRGTTLKTSGGYEVFVDQHSARAVMSLRLGQEELYLLEIPDTISAGEANIAASQLDIDGNLRISFQRGNFLDAQATQEAAEQAAVAVNDIQADVIDSFIRPEPAPSSARLKRASQMEILLESPDDNLAFADLVQAALKKINPRAAACARPVPSLENATARELALYLNADEVDWDLPTRRDVLARIARSGHKTDGIDPVGGFENVKLIRLARGDRLVEAGDPASFVYIPLGQGLRVIPLGGYASFPVQAWAPLGITGVIRGAARNAAILAEDDVSLLMIPKAVYLRHWHHVHSVAELTSLFQARVAAETARSTHTLTRIEVNLILKKVPLFAEIPEATLNELAGFVSELHYTPGETVFAEGELGDSLYVIADGRVKIHIGEQALNDLSGNDVFGEMALLDPEPRMASATAVEPTRLLQLDQARFQELLAQYPDVGHAILRVLSRHLRARAQEVIDLKNQLAQLDGRATQSSGNTPGRLPA